MAINPRKNGGQSTMEKYTKSNNYIIKVIIKLHY